MESQSGRKQGSTSPCAACKLLRRRCAQDCVFAPYFPADEPQKFASVHKVFGASNVNKMLQELPEHQRSDAVSSMVYEANARVRDPVYGCVGAISSLQQQIDALQTQLAIAQAEVVHMRMGQFAITTTTASTTTCSPDQKMAPDNSHHHHHHRSHQTATTKSFFSMDMAADQANMGESLWSC
ncbi:unnamed protein product [Malus baccata var. baccata]|uniref:LOB domain-containing protein 4-like n=1 Tax=Malus sylvestris TaxID=3752 RepID=UPI0004989BDB|nr:LOB domain-containing protein 4-like [Malus domestica]XP_050149065.1 LOB domain-containing protein 4-like [Malus sylvestris]